jgi:hypothetical protein
VASELSTPELAPQITAPPPAPLLQDKGTVRWSPRPVSAEMTDAGRPARSVAASAVVAALSSALAAGEPPLEVDVPSVPAPGSAAARRRSWTPCSGRSRPASPAASPG